MAATTGGFAIGSAVGHTVGYVLTGAFSSNNTEPAAQAPLVAATPQQSFGEAQNHGTNWTM